MAEGADIASGRLRPQDYARNFESSTPRSTTIARWSRRAAAISATTRPASRPVRPASTSRASSAGSHRQRQGRGHGHPEANIMGGTCARVCPTEVLCEGACVRTAQEGKPVKIGHAPALRHRLAVRPGHPALHSAPRRPASASPWSAPGRPASPAPTRWPRAGHDVVVFEARPSPAASTSTASPPTRCRRLRPEARSTSSSRIGGIEMRTGSDARPRRPAGRPAPRLRRRVPRHRPRRRERLALPTRSSPASIDAVDYIDAAAPGRGHGHAAGRPRRGGDRRRQHRHRHRDPEPAPGRRERHHRLPPRAGADGRHRARAGAGPDQRRQDHATGRGRAPDRRAAAMSAPSSSSTTRARRRRPRSIGTGDTFTLRADMVFKAIGQKLVPAGSTASAEPAGDRAAARSRSTPSGRPRCPASGPAATPSRGPGSDRGRGRGRQDRRALDPPPPR